MSRREFTRSVRVDIIKRAGVTGIILCEKCRGFAKRFEIHHLKEDALETDKGAKLTATDGILLCKPCHDELTRPFQTIIAKVKRVEANHLGASLKGRGFPKRPRERQPRPSKSLPFKPMFEDSP